MRLFSQGLRQLSIVLTSGLCDSSASWSVSLLIFPSFYINFLQVPSISDIPKGMFKLDLYYYCSCFLQSLLCAFCENICKSIDDLMAEMSHCLSFLILGSFSASIKKSFSCSGGSPGGQHVNKGLFYDHFLYVKVQILVATRAEIRFSIDEEWIPRPIRQVMENKYGYRLNKDREMIIVSSKTRSQVFHIWVSPVF